MVYPNKVIVFGLRKKYPEGALVELISMDDPAAPLPGTMGTVQYVDDIGSIHVLWENGSTLAVAYGHDSCKVIF